MFRGNGFVPLFVKFIVFFPFAQLNSSINIANMFPLHILFLLLSLSFVLSSPIIDDSARQASLQEILESTMKPESAEPEGGSIQTKIEKTEHGSTSVEVSQLTRVLADTTKVLQMVLLKEMSIEQKREEVEDEKASDSNINEISDDTSDTVILSSSEECHKLAQYSAYRYTIFTHIKDEGVNNCVATVLENMKSKCLVFYSEERLDQARAQTTKYYLATQLFSCYFESSLDTFSESSSLQIIVNGVARLPDLTQIAFHEYLDEIKFLCCYFKLTNDTMTLNDIVSYQVTQITEIWDTVKVGVSSFQSLPSNVCRKYWVIEAVISQIAPFPFCYNRKYFSRYQNWFLAFFVTTGAFYGWVKQIRNYN